MPGYQSLYEVAGSLGCQVEPWPLHRQVRDEGLLAARASLCRMCGPQPVGAESIRCVSGRMRGSLASYMPSSNLPQTRPDHLLPCSAPDGSLSFRLEDARHLIGGPSPPKLVVVNSPHNPSVRCAWRAALAA